MEEKLPQLNAKTWWQEAMTTTLQMLVLVVVLLLIQSFIFIPVTVSGDSMYPTLQNRQMIYVTKLSSVQQNDIVVVRKEDESGKLVVKRVVAVGGQHLQIRTDWETGLSHVYVDGVLQSEEWIKEPMRNAREWDIVLAEDEIFLLGDNRNISLDSEDYGPLHRTSIIGKMIIKMPMLGGSK